MFSPTKERLIAAKLERRAPLRFVINKLVATLPAVLKRTLSLAFPRPRTPAPPHQRPGHVKEWFDLPAAEVIDRISALPELSGCNPMRNLTPKLKSNDILYDDWREQRKKYIDQKWRLFLFQEDSPRPYIKLSYGALYEHAYRYAFTFNPYPVYVVAGFDDPGAPERKTALNEDRNRRVVEAWQSVQKSLGSLFAEEVGWLKAGTQPADVARILEQYGIRAFDLARPKPAGAPLTEASLKTGGPLPMARVRPAADIY